MSRWKFGKFEAEVDFTDADFMDALEEAQQELADRSMEAVKQAGTASWWPTSRRRKIAVWTR